jgi:hypothetical protein
MDMDNIENNKFWKDIIRYVLTAAVTIVGIVYAYHHVTTSKMISNGYEYRRVPVAVRQTADYNYEWVKVGTSEYKEAEKCTIPEREPNKHGGSL